MATDRSINATKEIVKKKKKKKSTFFPALIWSRIQLISAALMHLNDLLIQSK